MTPDELAELDSLIRLSSDDGPAGQGIASLSLADFCARYLYIQDKRDQLVPLVLKRAQRHFIEHMTGRDIILKARQLGFSTAIQAYMFKRAIEQPARFVTMAHDDITTQKLRRMSNIFYDHLDPALGVLRTSDNAGITGYTNLSEITIKTAGARTGGRGGTYGAGMHASEVAFWIDAASIVSGAMQAIPADGFIFLESTANGATGMFYQEVQKALKGESEYTLHFYPWWWDDEYQSALEPGETLTYTAEEQALVDKHSLIPEQIQWRRRKMREPEMDVLFAQEYPEDVETCFLTSGHSAFPNVHLVMGPPVQTDPQATHEYVAGLDWGQDDNYSALCIFDKITHQEVYLNRWRHLPYSVIRKQVVEACMAWHVRRIVQERNSMASNVESLIDDFEAQEYFITTAPLVMSLTVKHELVTNFKLGYQEQGMRLLDIQYAKHELNIFVKKQTPSLLWTYGAEGKGGADDEAQDDTVIARLLGWHATLIEAAVWGASPFEDYRGD